MDDRYPYIRQGAGIDPSPAARAVTARVRDRWARYSERPATTARDQAADFDRAEAAAERERDRNNDR